MPKPRQVENGKPGRSGFPVSPQTPPAGERTRTARPLPRGIPFPRSSVRAIVLVTVAELERSLIVERVKAGLRNAKAKGKHLDRPRKILDTKRIAVEMGVVVGTIYRAALEGSKIREKVF